MYSRELQLKHKVDSDTQLNIVYKSYEIQVTMLNGLKFGGFDNDTLDDLHTWQASSLEQYLTTEYKDTRHLDDSRLYLNTEVKYLIVDELISKGLLDGLDSIVKLSSDEDYFLPITDKKDTSKVTSRYDAYKYYDSGLIYLTDKLTLTQYLGTYDEIVDKLKEDLKDWDIELNGFEIDKSRSIQQDNESRKKKEETSEETKLSPAEIEDAEEMKNAEQNVITAEDCTNVNWPGKDEDGFCDKVLQILRFKRAILLQGPPGTGKTKIAEALAYKWFKRDDGRLAITDSDKKLLGIAELRYDVTPVDSYHFCEVQFSEEYSYSDFVEGLKPNEETGNWRMVDGPLKKMCDRAKRHPEQKFILFIDEINRANTEAVIGEMLNLMEKRDRSITLKSGNRLSMPYNLYIIATMNTIDRGAGTLNFATISRFAEIDIEQTSKRIGASGSRLTADDILTHKLNPVVHGDKEYAELSNRLGTLMKIVDTINAEIVKDDQISSDNTSIQIGYRCLYTGYQNSYELDLAAKYDLLPELKSRRSRLLDSTYTKCEKLILGFCNRKITQPDDVMDI